MQTNLTVAQQKLRAALDEGVQGTARALADLAGISRQGLYAIITTPGHQPRAGVVAALSEFRVELRGGEGLSRRYQIDPRDWITPAGVTP